MYAMLILLVYVIIIFFVIIIFIAIISYNRIIRYRNQTDNAFGSVDAMLKKRFDLLPNLVEVAKQYAAHETNIFTEITRLRAQLQEKHSSNDKVEIYNDISRKLGTMFVTFENYPDLKANVNFLKLQSNWTEAEEQISASRRFYNSSVTDYNNSIQTFPANYIAKYFKFEIRKVFEADEVERKNVSAKELFNR